MTVLESEVFVFKPQAVGERQVLCRVAQDIAGAHLSACQAPEDCS
jgi:hypothetical protein